VPKNLRLKAKLALEACDLDEICSSLKIKNRFDRAICIEHYLLFNNEGALDAAPIGIPINVLETNKLAAKLGLQGDLIHCYE